MLFVKTVKTYTTTLFYIHLKYFIKSILETASVSVLNICKQSKQRHHLQRKENKKVLFKRKENKQNADKTVVLVKGVAGKSSFRFL